MQVLKVLSVVLLSSLGTGVVLGSEPDAVKSIEEVESVGQSRVVGATDECISRREMSRRIDEMLDATMRDPKSASTSSYCDYLRFIHSEKWEETGAPWYSHNDRRLIDEEGPKYVDKYVDRMLEYYPSDLRMLLLKLSYPVVAFENNRGFKILVEKFQELQNK